MALDRSKVVKLSSYLMVSLLTSVDSKTSIKLGCKVSFLSLMSLTIHARWTVKDMKGDASAITELCRYSPEVNHVKCETILGALAETRTGYRQKTSRRVTAVPRASVCCAQDLLAYTNMGGSSTSTVTTLYTAEWLIPTAHLTFSR